jgi:AcrR family transcriptional regulator
MVDRRVKPAASRPYDSVKRTEAAARTRQAIREAALELFLRDGYARTSMKAIAARAGVSEKTMYLAYDTKPALLRHVIEVAVREDEDPAPLSQRRQWRDILAGPPDEAFARFAALNASLMARTAAIVNVGETAAASDPGLAAIRDRAHRAGHHEVRLLVSALSRAGALAHGVDEDEAADVIWAISTDETLYLRLTQERGWSDARYADLIQRVLDASLGHR